MISGYNSEAPPVRNLFQIVAKELKLYGFLSTSLFPKYGEEFYREVPRMIKSGELKYTEDVKKGLRFAGEALYEVQAGLNNGKSVIQVAED